MRRAFTLLEVLLALMLIALLAGAIFGFLWNVMDRRDALVHATAEAQSAGALFELLESDLACAVAGDPVMGAGVAGEMHRLRVMSRRVWAPAHASNRSAAEGDLQISEFTFDPGRGVLSVRRWPAEDGRARSQSASAPWEMNERESDEVSTSPRAQAEPIAERLHALRIRYFDGEVWVESFDSLQRESLPVAIEVAVWYRRGSQGAAGGAGRPPAGGAGEMNGRWDEGRNVMAGEAYSVYDDWDDEAPEVPRRSPDRLRVISIPDGPTTAWSDLR